MPLVLLLMMLAPPPPLTLRLDYYHTGSASEERFSLDGVAQERAWPGPLSKTADTSNLGKYSFEVRDEKSGALLYSRGFASIHGEWETTPEAKRVSRTFHESVRFPAPAGPANVKLFKRDSQNRFSE